MSDDRVPDAQLTEVEQAARVLRQEMLADLGGSDHVSATKRALIDSTTETWIIAQVLDVVLFRMAGDQGLVSLRHRRVFPIVIDRLRVADTLRAQLLALGLDRASPPLQDLNAHIDERYGQNGSPADDAEKS